MPSERSPSLLVQASAHCSCYNHPAGPVHLLRPRASCPLVRPPPVQRDQDGRRRQQLQRRFLDGRRRGTSCGPELTQPNASPPTDVYSAEEAIALYELYDGTMLPHIVPRLHRYRIRIRRYRYGDTLIRHFSKIRIRRYGKPKKSEYTYSIQISLYQNNHQIKMANHRHC
jgi:hypothetical protein